MSSAVFKGLVGEDDGINRISCVVILVQDAGKDSPIIVFSHHEVARFAQFFLPPLPCAGVNDVGDGLDGVDGVMDIDRRQSIFWEIRCDVGRALVEDICI